MKKYSVFFVEKPFKFLMYPRAQNDHEILTQFLFSGVNGMKWKG